MKKQKLTKKNWIAKISIVCAAIGWICWSAPNLANAQTPPPNPAVLSPELQEVLKLSQQHMTDDVIVGYIATSGKTYKLSGDDIVYLSGQGVSQAVIKAMLEKASPGGSSSSPVPPSAALYAPAAAAPSAPPAGSPAPEPPAIENTAPPVAPAAVAQPAAPPAPTLDYFQAQLAPYGNWIQLPPYGLCWQPAVAPGWRPYYDAGHWEYTDAGWYWQSDYHWGDIPFHYGRWAYTVSGWVWIPGFDYAPAWVFWRHADSDGYMGWAPLPVGALFVDGGWAFNGVHVGFDFDFGLRASFFTFVDCNHFWERDLRLFVLPHDRLELVFRRSMIDSHYRLDHGRFINEGLGRDRMAALTHHEIKVVALRDIKEKEEHRNLEARQAKVEATHAAGAPGHQPATPGHAEQPGKVAATTPPKKAASGPQKSSQGTQKDDSKSK
jgi:hypothetical protein